jgi:WD40 repeat protein
MEKKGAAKKEMKEQFFLKQITEKPPSTAVCDATKPDCAYEIDHVYGFSGDRNKSMCYFGKTKDEIVFGTAALGVVQDLKTRK